MSFVCSWVKQHIDIYVQLKSYDDERAQALLRLIHLIISRQLGEPFPEMLTEDMIENLITYGDKRIYELVFPAHTQIDNETFNRALIAIEVGAGDLLTYLLG